MANTQGRRLHSGPPDLHQVLIEADESFAESGDPIEALQWVAFAARTGLALPPEIGLWLASGIEWQLQAYAHGNGKQTLEHSLCLIGSGKADPRRVFKESLDLQQALGRMHVLQALGATIPQAAALVRSLLKNHAEKTLIDRYRRSGLTERLPASKLVWGPLDVESVLGDYPAKSGRVAEIKLAIRGMYAKR